MKNNNHSVMLRGYCFLFCIGLVNSTYGMGLRSFVALPVEKDGGVVRLAFESTKDSDVDSLTTSMAYGVEQLPSVIGSPALSAFTNRR